MPIETEQTAQLNTIRLEGPMDISAAAQLKVALTDAIRCGGTLHLSLEHVTNLDVTAMQLLWAAERAARLAGVQIEVDQPLPQDLVAKLASAGFSGFPLP